MKIRNIIAASAIVAALGLPTSAVAQTDMVDCQGVPSPPPPGESAIDYQLRMYDRYDCLYRRNDEIFQAQQQQVKADMELLRSLSRDDPRRSELRKELLERVSGWRKGIMKTMDEYSSRRGEFKQLIQDYKERTGSYPSHDCASAPGWHLPAGAKCDSPSTDPHAGSSGHGP